MSRLALAFLAALAVAAIFAPFAGMYGEMATALSAHLAVPLVALGVWSFVRQRRADTAIVAVALFGLMSTCSRAPDLGTPGSGLVDVIVVNAFEDNVVPAAAVDAALGDADVVVLIEPRDGLVDELASRHIAVRHTIGDKFDVAAFADPKLVQTATVHRFDDAESVTGEIVVRTEKGPVALFFVHVPAPTSRSQQVEREALQPALGDLFADRSMPVVVAGDFNSAPTSPLLSAIASKAELRILTGRPTWPIGWGWFGVAIDHVLATEDANVSTPVPFVLPGSDHLGWRFSISPRPRGS